MDTVTWSFIGSLDGMTRAKVEHEHDEARSGNRPRFKPAVPRACGCEVWKEGHSQRVGLCRGKERHFHSLQLPVCAIICAIKLFPTRVVAFKEVSFAQPPEQYGIRNLCGCVALAGGFVIPPQPPLHVCWCDVAWPKAMPMRARGGCGGGRLVSLLCSATAKPSNSARLRLAVPSPPLSSTSTLARAHVHVHESQAHTLKVLPMSPFRRRIRAQEIALSPKHGHGWSGDYGPCTHTAA